MPSTRQPSAVREQDVGADQINQAIQQLDMVTQQNASAAEEMSAGDRQQMIAGMVDSLAAKLADDPDNLEGWMRIIRSYVVLDQRPKAEAALQTALKTFPADSENGRQLVALARDLSISTGGGGQ